MSSPLTVNELREQAVRELWDPWDSYERVEKDGENIRRKSGGGLGSKQARKTLEDLVASGGIENLKAATPQSTDVVYLIQRVSGGAVKVGHTSMRALAQRFKSLQCAHDEELVVRALFDGGAWLEAALHELFRDSRVRGEWFKVTASMRLICPELQD